MQEYVVPDWQSRLSAAGLARLSDLLHLEPPQLGLAGKWQALVKPGLGGRQRWRWELPDGSGGSTVVYVKRYWRPGWKAQIDRLLRQTRRHSRAWWEFFQAQRLSDRQIPAVRAVGFAEELAGPFERCSVVVLEEARGWPLDRLWQEAQQQAAPITRGLARRDLICRLARFVAAFHQTGLCHRDLYLCHIFVDADLRGSRPPEFMLIDLARTIRPRLRRMRYIIKDLAQLDSSARRVDSGGAVAGTGITRTDRLRFLQAYLGLDASAPRLRWYAARIVRKSDWILGRLGPVGRKR